MHFTRLAARDRISDLTNREWLQCCLKLKLKEIRTFDTFAFFFLYFALCGSWEPVHSLKTMPQAEGTFPTAVIQILILGTRIAFFNHTCWQCQHCHTNKTRQCHIVMFGETWLSLARFSIKIVLFGRQKTQGRVLGAERKKKKKLREWPHALRTFRFFWPPKNPGMSFLGPKKPLREGPHALPSFKPF